MPKRLSLGQAKFLNKHRYILRKLARVSPSDRKKVFQKAPPQLFKALDIIFQLIANNQIPLSNKQEAVVKKHRRVIKSTANLKRAAIKQKFQSGGALGKVLSAVLPIVAGIVSKML
jgi:hypothetical protein